MATDLFQIPELVSLVCHHVSLESREGTLDPPLFTGRHRATSSLLALCRVNRLFSAECRPFLYRDISIGLPASFEALIGAVGVLALDGDERMGRNATPHYEEKDGLLTPPASRESSRDRDSPPTDFFMPVSVSQASNASLPSQYAKHWREDNPALQTQTITFERFRSHGLSRTVREGSRQRFVTPARVLQILQGTRGPGSLSQDTVDVPGAIHVAGKLKAIGLTEYIDSALTVAVLEEILLRGGTATVEDPQTLQGSQIARKTQPIEALDFCGCVSRTFLDSLALLAFIYNLQHGSITTLQEGARVSTTFPHLRRLGLYNVLLSSSLFTSFVTAFPNLTHLDLGGTSTTPALLSHIGKSTTIRLKSLSLARCQGLRSEAIRNFLIDSEPNVLKDLEELNMHYGATSAMPLIREHLQEILEASPVFASGKLRYLDLSTARLDDQLLSESFPAQPALLDLGLANCPQISWDALSTFVQAKAPKLEILELRGSCRQNIMAGLGGRQGGARRNDALLSTLMGIHQYLLRGAHSLRVIELDEKTLEALETAGTNHDWAVFWGKGCRGWYVNCAVEVYTDAVGERHLEKLEKDHPQRSEMMHLAKKSRKGGYNFGWHSRKMAILGEDGMLGREHGLYNFHAFS